LPEDLRLTPDEREQKKKKDEAFLNELMRLQEQIGQSNERIGEFIQQYETMARWYREQAAKAAEAMDKIAERMAKNSEFINDAKELIENGRTGQLDREKARRLLLERGIKTEEDVSNERLLELLERERLKAIQNNIDLGHRYDEQKERKDRFETAAKEIEAKARELKQRRDEINNNNDLSLEEKARLLKELEDQYSADVQYRAKELEGNKKIQQEQDLRYKETTEHAITKEDASFEDFGAGFDALKSGTPLNNQFAAAVTPAEKINPNNIDLDNPTGPDENKLGKNFGPVNYS